MGLDKTTEGYQEEGVIKLLKDIRDGIRNGRNLDDGNDGNDGNNGNDGDDNADMPDLETEEEAERIADFYEQKKRKQNK